MEAPHILIVDDDAVERSTLVDIFQLENFQVTEVTNGDLALEALSKGIFDLMLLDLHLVGMSGIEVLERVAVAYPRTKVIILTAHGSFDTAVQALRLRVGDYLAKPIRPEELLESIHRVLSKTEATETAGYAGEDVVPSTWKPAGSAALMPSSIDLSNGVTINCIRRIISWDACEISLTPIEARLIAYLFAHHKQLIAHQDLVKAVYDYSLSNLEAAKILRTAISRLNKKLVRIPGGRDWIENVRGAGYLLDVSPERIVP